VLQFLRWSFVRRYRQKLRPNRSQSGRNDVLVFDLVKCGIYAAACWGGWGESLLSYLEPWNNVTGVLQYLTESFTNFYQTADQATDGQNLVTFACTALGLYEDNLV
jgi:hypothetical protein